MILSTAACSISLMKRVPSNHQPDDYPDCSAGYTMPLVDAVLIVLTGATAVNLHSAASNPENDGKNFRTLAWVATASALGFLGSATYGAVSRNRCVRAKIRGGAIAEESPAGNRRLPGILGGKCRRDGSCDGDLICDTPMNTCIPLNPTDESLPPSQE